MKLLRSVLANIKEHALQHLPEESCGILLTRPDDHSKVTDVLFAENCERDHPGRRYVLGHKAHIKAVELETRGFARIFGYYHSHPESDARPSASDAKEAFSGMKYLILGLNRQSIDVALWQWTGKEFKPEAIKLYP